MPPDILVCRGCTRSGGANFALKGALALMLVFFLVKALIQRQWDALPALVPFTIICGTIFWFAKRERDRRARSGLEIDSQRGEIRLRHFSFVTGFLPEKPRPEATLRCSEILEVIASSNREGHYLRVRTEQGTFMVTHDMEHYEKIAAVLDEIVRANRANPETYQKSLNAEPKVRTTWWGWLILTGALAVVIALGWKFMYAE